MRPKSPAPEARAETIEGSLVVRRRKSGPVWYGFWRDSTQTQQSKKIGLAWLIERTVENPFLVDVANGSEAPRKEAWRARWEARRGRPQNGCVSHTEAVLELRERILAREIEIDEIGAQAGKPTSKTLCCDVIDSWLAERRRDVEDGHLKRSTLKDYESMLRKADAPVRKRGRKPTAWIRNAFDDLPVAEVTGDDIDAFEKKLKDAKLTPRTRTKYLTVVSMIFDHAVTKKLRETNPVLSRPKPKRRPRRRNPVPKVYSVEVVEKIASKAEHPIDDMIRAASSTGLRQGELLDLKIWQVDFEGRKITVAETWGGADIESDVPKGGGGRTIPLSDQAAAAFERVLDRERFTERHDLVFCNDIGGHIDGSTVRREYARARDKVARKETIERLTFHDLRHTFGSNCAAAGVPLGLIQQWMGHADIQTTQIYVHWVPRHDDAERLTRALSASAVG